MKKLVSLFLALVIVVSCVCVVTCAASEDWLWPIEGYYNISSGYGQRSSGWHKGIDIDSYGVGNISGKPVRAARGGYATVYHNNVSAGNYISIDHGDGYVSRYLHLDSIAIKNGNVERGQIIGYAGNTGNSTGPHLHFDIKYNGNEVNPMPVNSVGKHTYVGSSASISQSINYIYSINDNISSEIRISDPNQVIRYGDNSNAVRELQMCLNKIDKAGLVVDGKFGDATLKAVKNFQSNNGLVVDGDAGPNTNNKINSLLIHNNCSYSTGYDDAHPHKEYKKCSTCGKVEYTGNTRKVSGCSECHEHSYYTKYETVHPHNQYEVCDCGDKQYTGKTKEVADCEECHEHFYEIYYETAHPHKQYEMCDCGDRQYTGKTKEVADCEECHEHFYEIYYETTHPHKQYEMCDCGDKYYTGEMKMVKSCEECYKVKKSVKLQIGIPQMTVDGESYEIDPGRGTVPIIENGRTLLPIRMIAETFGAYVVWNEGDNSITIYKDDVTMMLWIGKENAAVNGKSCTLDVAPAIINDRTFMPLRFIAENLGLEVGWNNTNQTVTVEGEI